MPMTVRVTVPNLPTPLADESLLRDIGDLAIRMIRTRTEGGIDRSGKPFVAYTPGYAERKAKELGAGPVNLTVSGRMLNDMAITRVGNGAVSIGFRSSGGGTKGKGLTLIQRSRAVGAEDKARFHDVDGAGKSRVKREFLGLTGAETETVRARVQRYLDGLARANR